MTIEWIVSNANSLQNDSLWRGSTFTAATSKTINRIWMKTNALLGGNMELWSLSGSGGNFVTRLATGAPTYDSASSGCYLEFPSVTLQAGTSYMILGKASNPNVYFYASTATYNSYSWLTPPAASNHNYASAAAPSAGVAATGNSFEMGIGVELSGNFWVRSGGVWVLKTKNVKVAGVWQPVPTTKYKSGGAFN